MIDRERKKEREKEREREKMREKERKRDIELTKFYLSNYKVIKASNQMCFQLIQIQIAYYLGKITDDTFWRGGGAATELLTRPLLRISFKYVSSSFI